MKSVTLSISIRKDLKERMERLKDINWRREIERFIENKIREIGLGKILSMIEDTLRDISVSEEPAWKSIRELRDNK